MYLTLFFMLHIRTNQMGYSGQDFDVNGDYCSNQGTFLSLSARLYRPQQD